MEQYANAHFFFLKVRRDTIRDSHTYFKKIPKAVLCINECRTRAENIMLQHAFQIPVGIQSSPFDKFTMD